MSKYWTALFASAALASMISAANAEEKKYTADMTAAAQVSRAGYRQMEGRAGPGGITDVVDE